MPNDPKISLEPVGGQQGNVDEVVDNILSSSGMAVERVEGHTDEPVVEPKVEPAVEPKPLQKPENGGMPLKELLGEGYEDVNQVRTLLKRGETFTPDVEQELMNLRSLRNDYETKVKSFQPYKNSAYYKLDKLEEMEPDNVQIYRNILFGNPDPLELVKLKLISDNPDVFKEDKEALELHLQDKYPELFDDDIEKDSPDYKRALTRLKVDANAAKKMFQEKIDRIEIPDPKKQTDDLNAKRQNLAQRWQQPWMDIKNDFKKIPVMVLDKDGKSTLEITSVELNPADSEPLLKQAAQFIVQGLMEPTKENVESVKRFMLSLWIQSNLPKYNTMIAEHVSKSKDGNWRKLVHNPKTVAPAPQKVESLGTADDIISQMKADGEVFSQY